MRTAEFVTPKHGALTLLFLLTAALVTRDARAESSAGFSFDAPLSNLTVPGLSWSSSIVGDFNGDGKPDLVFLSLSSNDVWIQLGNGDGTLQPPTPLFAFADPPSGLSKGDFNNDGKLDVVVGNSQSSRFSVLIGNGDGTFQPPLTNILDSTPVYILSADLNHDGNADLAVITRNDLEVFLGKGDGTFSPALQLFAGFNPSQAAVGDFNGDGNLDLALACEGVENQDESLSILLGNGDGRSGSLCFPLPGTSRRRYR